MQTSNRILDDLARVANGAVSTLTGIREELEAMIRHQLERLLADRDTVPREEFEAVKAMAAKARSQQEKLEKRVAALEAKLSGKPPAKAAKPRRPKPAAKPAAKPDTQG